MKKNINKIMDSYRFQDDKKMVITVPVIHILFSALFLTMDWSNLLTDLRTQLCVFIAVTFLGLYLFYNWRSSNINVMIAVFYLLTIGLELFYLGIPNSALTVSDDISRGVLFEMLLSTFPHIYLAIRIGAIFPLIKIIFSSKTFDKFISQ